MLRTRSKIFKDLDMDEVEQHSYTKEILMKLIIRGFGIDHKKVQD